MSSLRKKILYAFGLLNVAILAIALTAYADLKLLRDQIVNSEKVGQLISATQQMQNHEEIIQLYQSPESWFQLGEQVKQMRELFRQYRTFFDEVIGSAQTAKLDGMLTQYRDRIEELGVMEATDNPVTATTLNDMSRGIREIVHQISIEHHESLSQKVHLVSWILVITLTAVIIMGVISALFISRQVVQPISALERQLDAVADGKAKKLTLVSDNIEIRSFVQHFNNMLYKQRAQQSQIRHHEKAAALGVLVSGVAHELNTPLSNISTSVQLLMEDDSDARLRQQWLAHVDSESERARRIVRRLLDSVRQPKQNLQSISSNDLVNSAVMLIHRQLDPSILLHIEDVADTPVKVDRERMQQVFINLIKNAHDAGARNIWIVGYETTWQQSRPKNRDKVVGDITEIRQAERVLQYLIDDDGPGIPPEHMAKIFDPFFSTQSGGEGTGLGLYLVEEIVSEHSGCITVDHRPGGGTRFSVWLPMEPPETNVKSETL
jgi:signal transduction histidine kinase